ncbi:hypothetical protein JCM10512_1665 [Bacteroides reticulotermitis JCM 10512]|uniref:DUF1828 domain-containing protein n=2 Tax=Bacteroides reticulotermitis TaxID=1133319 RepID=W4UQD9_9BACE|nr:hypothetical protein JCM10512_1665 [Bacteroides reticulotermitis JCM 10512]
MVSTPYAGLFNDSIDLYVKKSRDVVVLTDNGETIDNLSLMGVDLSKGKRRELANSISNLNGVVIKNGEIRVECDMSDFYKAKHNILMAILDISNMQYLSKPNIKSIFREDVERFFNKKEMIYTPNFIVKGKSGLEYKFEFQIAGRADEMLIKTFDEIRQDGLERFLFSWGDVKESREKDTNGKNVRGLAIINDTISEPNPVFLDAMKSKGTEIQYWSKRQSSDFKNAFNVA